jgi:protocatechuate 3,4-dioxygenase beta subunit
MKIDGMQRGSVAAIALVLALVLPSRAQGPVCAPTPPDALGPFYTPGAPERAATGRGLVVTGTVRSAAGCLPLAQARIEWWSANPKGDYDDAHRATQATDPSGRYRYETDSPGRYPGRPIHLHVRISAPGHRLLVTQLYPKPADTTLAADFVLARD